MITLLRILADKIADSFSHVRPIMQYMNGQSRRSAPNGAIASDMNGV